MQVAGDFDFITRQLPWFVTQSDRAERHLRRDHAADIFGWLRIVIAGDPDGVDARRDAAKGGEIGCVDALPCSAIMEAVAEQDQPPRSGFGDDGGTLYMTANDTLRRIRTTTKGQGF